VEITEVKLTLKNKDRLRGFANITFDEAFVIRGLKIINGNNGLFISMPSRKKQDGSFQDIAHPITAEMRKRIEDRILEVYYKEVELQNQKQTS
jgi:stage V sporulation protein G